MTPIALSPAPPLRLPPRRARPLRIDARSGRSAAGIHARSSRSPAPRRTGFSAGSVEPTPDGGSSAMSPTSCRSSRTARSLRALPEGSLGRAYLSFVESEGISPEGIRDASLEKREAEGARGVCVPAQQDARHARLVARGHGLQGRRARRTRVAGLHARAELAHRGGSHRRDGDRQGTRRTALPG